MSAQRVDWPACTVLIPPSLPTEPQALIDWAALLWAERVQVEHEVWALRLMVSRLQQRARQIADEPLPARPGSEATPVPSANHTHTSDCPREWQ